MNRGCFQLISLATKRSALIGFLEVMIFRTVRKEIGKNIAVVFGEMGFVRFPGLLGRHLHRIWSRFPQLQHS